MPDAKNETISVIPIFEAIQAEITGAEESDVFSTAQSEVCISLLRLLQNAKPKVPEPQLEKPLVGPFNSFAAIKQMFEFQKVRWGYTTTN
jgi:hypothetical protein